MRNNLLRTTILIVTAVSILSIEAFASPAPELQARSTSAVERFLRTELFFGLSKPDGSEVTDEEWIQFLDDVVSPAFPKGYTILLAEGRYQDSGGRTIAERSRVLVILYPKNKKLESRRKIDMIRAAYIERFDQEAVIRMDLPGSVDVSFN